MPGAFAERETDHGRVAAELALELEEMAGWLGLSGVLVASKGNLATALRKAVGR